jgi:opacity protein-like surface antigen
MKNRLYTIVLLVAVLLVSVHGFGQKKNGIYLRSVGVEAGYLMPKMDYWNDVYLPVNGWDDTFSGNIVYGAEVDVHFYKGIILKLSGSMWNESLENDNVAKIESQMSFIDLELMYSFKQLLSNDIYPYVGLGSSLVMINNTMTGLGENTDVEEERTGQDNAWFVNAGIMYEVHKNFGISIDYKHRLGNYSQQSLGAEGNFIENDVSISGPQIGIGVHYLF